MRYVEKSAVVPVPQPGRPGARSLAHGRSVGERLVPGSVQSAMDATQLGFRRCVAAGHAVFFVLHGTRHRPARQPRFVDLPVRATVHPERELEPAVLPMAPESDRADRSRAPVAGAVHHGCTGEAARSPNVVAAPVHFVDDRRNIFERIYPV